MLLAQPQRRPDLSVAVKGNSSTELAFSFRRLTTRSLHLSLPLTLPLQLKLALLRTSSLPLLQLTSLTFNSSLPFTSPLNSYLSTSWLELFSTSPPIHLSLQLQFSNPTAQTASTAYPFSQPPTHILAPVLTILANSPTAKMVKWDSDADQTVTSPPPSPHLTN